MRPKEFPLQLWGFVWHNDNEGNWQRYMIRRTREGKFCSSQLFHVLSQHPVCLHCLSQNVLLQEEGEQLQCRDCKITYRILEEEGV